jgi:uncharacterized membrane protein
VTGRLELAGVAIGLAAAAKYPGALVLVPLVVVAWRMWRRLALSLALAAVAFFAASPFVLLDAGSTFTVALALLVTGRLELAGVAIGLAAAAKYPGALALVPLVVVAWRQWRRLALSSGSPASHSSSPRPLSCSTPAARGRRSGASSASTGAAGSASSTIIGPASRSPVICGTRWGPCS